MTFDPAQAAALSRPRTRPAGRELASNYLEEELDEPMALLGGLSARQFMRQHWQKKPLLIRQAVPDVRPPIERAELFALAAREEVESRLITQAPAGKARAKGKSRAPHWQLQHGPFERGSLPARKRAAWTLLVQGLDLHVPAARALLERFRFTPEARLDDVMVSWASDAGGVGPHFDSYDVFLLQVQGQRRWRVAQHYDTSLQAGVPLKILQNFQAEQEWVLEPGDMLYLPPMWAHDGQAIGECMTCSIGFRAPLAGELARELLVRWVDEAPEPRMGRYQDPRQAASATPARLPAQLQQYAQRAVAALLRDPQGLQTALGELLTEPKPRVWFSAAQPLAEDGAQAVVLDARTRMVYDERQVYINGESWRVGGADAIALRRLADERALPVGWAKRASPALKELLAQWVDDGWLHAVPAPAPAQEVAPRPKRKAKAVSKAKRV